MSVHPLVHAVADRMRRLGYTVVEEQERVLVRTMGGYSVEFAVDPSGWSARTLGNRWSPLSRLGGRGMLGALVHLSMFASLPSFIWGTIVMDARPGTPAEGQVFLPVMILVFLCQVSVVLLAFLNSSEDALHHVHRAASEHRG